MEYLIIIGLILLGIVLFLLEVFLIPGISIAGFVALCTMAYACVYAFTELGTTAGYLTLVTVVIVGAVALYMVVRSRTLDRISLKKEIKSSVDNQAERSIRVGDEGNTVTRLALIGWADFGNQTVEVKSIDGFIDEDTPIVVIRIEEGTILVKPKQLTL